MTQRGPWSVKGIDNRARDAAREAAREEGMTLGAYLNKLILEEDPSQPASSYNTAPNNGSGRTPHPEPHQKPAAEAHPASRDLGTTSLDRLTRRIESAEARSTLAITGIDQSVVGLLSRLENAEHNQQAMGGHLEGVMDDIHKTYEALNVKVKRIEDDDSTATNLRALKALEDALGKLASHVYTENELVSEETNAIKARLESGLHELSERAEAVDSQIEQKLDKASKTLTAETDTIKARLESGLNELSERTDAVDSQIEQKIEKTSQELNQIVQEAEERTESASQQLAERFSAVELDVADKFSHVSEMSASMDNVHEEVTSSIADINSTLSEMQERLSRAETVTDQAMHGLEGRLEALDSRLDDVRKFAAEDAEKAFQDRFETLSEDLRQLVASTRAELAKEIEAAANSVDAEVIAKLNDSIDSISTRLESSEDIHAQTIEMVGDTVSRITDSVDQRLSANQEQQGRAIEQVSQQVSRISEGLIKRLDTVEEFSGKAENDALREEMIRFTNTLDERLEYLENHEDATFEKISTEVEKIADRLEERVANSEKESASAIQQVGEQVANVTSRLEQRQTEALAAFATKLDSTQKRQDARLSGALSSVSDRLERMQEQSLVSMSPVQKAITALAQRLEAVEDFSTPPYVERASAPAIPDMVVPSKVDTNLVTETDEQDVEMTFEDHVEDKIETHNTPDEAPEAEELEGFLSPIFSSDPEEEEALAEDFEDIDLLASDLEVDLEVDLQSETSELEQTEADITPEIEDFEPGYMSWTEDANAVLDDTLSVEAADAAPSETLEASDLPPPMPDQVEAEPIWHDGREEARDADIFEDDFQSSDYEDDLQSSSFDQTGASLDAFEVAANVAEPETEAEPPADQDDYISQARRAARNAADVSAAAQSGRKGKTKTAAATSSSGISPKHASIAALAAVAVVGTAGALYVRGQDKTPTVSFNADADRLAKLTDNNLSASEAADPASVADTASAAVTPISTEEAPLEATSLASATLETDAPEIAAEPDTGSAFESEAETVEPVDTISQDTQSVAPESTIVSSLASVPAFSAPRIPARISVSSAAQEGNPIAQFQTGMADLQSGKFESAANWLKKAAEQDLAIAQHQLAILHEDGTGTTRDPEEARRLHGAAAKGGHVEAMFDFSTYNINGEGGEANAQVAAEWFRKAAEFGHVDSQYNLAQLYTQGSGVSPSQIEALYWFELAAKGGDTDARQAASDLVAADKVSSEAAAQVSQRVDAWNEASIDPVANGQFGSQPWESTGEQNIAVQRVLKALGYPVGTPDGVIGAQTQAAIRTFELSAGIPETGTINDRLVDNLNAAAEAERRRS